MKFAFNVYELALAIVGMWLKTVGSQLTSLESYSTLRNATLHCARLLCIAKGYSDNAHKGLHSCPHALRGYV
jgi:hypothetical protein